MKDLRIELKICEGCGVLWLRAVSGGSYCHGCATWMSDCPVSWVGEPSKTKKRRGRTLRTLVCSGGVR
jgi:Pyruvate/2-oxoacid:ferredoxin oxidoreductase delta subunit